MENKNILHEMNVLKGIAITAVVIIHLDPLLLNSSSYIKRAILTFGSFMYIFMFVSGFLYGHSRIEIKSLSAYCDFVAKKFKRLMVPYFILSLIILLLKYIAGNFIVLKVPLDQNFWKYILINPAGGFSEFLWFLYVLFLIFMIFPVLKNLSKNSYVLFLIVIFIYFYPIKDGYYFNYERVKYYLVFFYIGYLCSKNQFGMKSINIKLYYLTCFISFAILFIEKDTFSELLAEVTTIYESHRLVELFLGTLGTLSFYHLSVYLARKKNILFRMANYVGLYSSAIYILHTISIGTITVLFVNI